MRSFIILAFFAFHSFVFANDQVYDPERLSKTTLLSDLNRPMELEVAPDGRIFFVELDGASGVLNLESKKVAVSVRSAGSGGVVEIRLGSLKVRDYRITTSHSEWGLG